jgi:hypothetical protein
MNIVDELVAEPTRRDRWGRYLVVPPTGGKPVGYTRATTIAKTLDDSGGLLGWGKRMVAIGLGRRPDLVGLIASTDSNDKKALDELCERAAEAGGSTVRRDQGIALHAALESAWHDPEVAPGMFLEDVRAVHRALKEAGLRPVPEMAERIVVNDAFQVAGTFDLVLTDGLTQLRRRCEDGQQPPRRWPSRSSFRSTPPPTTCTSKVRPRTAARTSATRCRCSISAVA